LKAFNQANDIANRQRMAHTEYYFETGLLPAEGRSALRSPLITHGVEANRLVLETIAQYSVEQGLTNRLMKLDEIFAPSTMKQ
jgi:4,5-dihydroxyphthalate decarboxylase